MRRVAFRCDQSVVRREPLGPVFAIDLGFGFDLGPAIRQDGLCHLVKRIVGGLGLVACCACCAQGANCQTAAAREPRGQSRRHKRSEGADDLLRHTVDARILAEADGRGVGDVARDLRVGNVLFGRLGGQIVARALDLLAGPIRDASERIGPAHLGIGSGQALDSRIDGLGQRIGGCRCQFASAAHRRHSAIIQHALGDSHARISDLAEGAGGGGGRILHGVEFIGDVIGPVHHVGAHDVLDLLPGGHALGDLGRSQAGVGLPAL